MIEAFFQGGRAALTARSSPIAQAEPVVGASTGASSAAAVLLSATAWSMSSIWDETKLQYNESQETLTST